jgi:hypothetical protein
MQSAIVLVFLFWTIDFRDTLLFIEILYPLSRIDRVYHKDIINATDKQNWQTFDFYVHGFYKHLYSLIIPQKQWDATFSFRQCCD